MRRAGQLLLLTGWVYLLVAVFSTGCVETA
jgi:hypothetical protein